MSQGDEHILQIKASIDFSTARQQSAEFRKEQQAQPVQMAGQGAAGPGAGVGAQQTVAMQAAQANAAVRQQQASVDARRALVTTSADAFVQQQLAKMGASAQATIGALPAGEQLAVARAFDPAGYRAAVSADREASRVMARESTRQSSLARYGESRELLYENRLAGDRARQQRQEETTQATTARRDSAAARAIQRSEDRQQTLLENREVGDRLREQRGAERTRAKAEAREEKAFAERERGRVLPAERVAREAQLEARGAIYDRDDAARETALRELGQGETDNAAAREAADDEARQQGGGSGGLGRGRGRGGGGGGRGAAGGRGTGRLFGLRAGRLGQFFTLGFAALETSRIVQAYQRQEDEIALSGGNQEAILSARQRFQQALEGTPIIGPIGAALADAVQSGFYGTDVSRRGTALIQQAGKQTDADTEAMAMRAGARRSQERSIAIASTRNRSQVERLSLQFGLEDQLSEAERAKRTAAERDTEAVYNLRQRQDTPAERLRRSDALLASPQFHPELRRPSGEFIDIRAQNLAQTDATARAGAQIDTEIESERSRRARIVDADYSGTVDRARRLNRAQLKALDDSEKREGGALRADILVSRLRGAGDTFSAALVQEIHQTLTSAWYDAAPQNALLTLRAGAAHVSAIISDTRRQNLQESRRYEAEAESARAQARGENYEAERIKLRASRDAELSSPLLNNPVVNLLGLGGRVRQSITSAYEAQIGLVNRQEGRNLEALNIERDVSGLQAEGRPVGAQILRVMRETFLRATGESGDARNTILQTGVNQENEIRRKLLFGGRPEEITGGTFKPGAGEGNPQAEEQTSLLRQILDSINKLQSGE